jgi:murein DD-endopeptidase MepM/ murein hydrolase activator NlpD
MAQLDDVGAQLGSVQAQLDDKEAKLLQAGKDLEDAEARIANQDKLLQSRIRLMYSNGFVSYLDVLMSATSFEDFLGRLDSLQTILGQDRQILESRKQEKALIASKKKEIETSLAEVRTLYAKLDDYQDLLKDKEKEKEVMVLQYSQKAQELEEISGDQEEALIALAKKESELEAKKRTIKTYFTGGKLAVPLHVDWRLSSPFGIRVHPVTGVRKMHTGIDMAAPKGTPVYAAESGVVIVNQWMGGYGNCIIIDHGGGLWTLYGHLLDGSSVVKKGETVKRGEKIAGVGMTGTATGYHLHFEVRKNEEPVNPLPYIR